MDTINKGDTIGALLFGGLVACMWVLTSFQFNYSLLSRISFHADYLGSHPPRWWRIINKAIKMADLSRRLWVRPLTKLCTTILHEITTSGAHPLVSSNSVFILDDQFERDLTPLRFLVTIDIGLIFNFLYSYLITNYGNFDSVAAQGPTRLVRCDTLLFIQLISSTGLSMYVMSQYKFLEYVKMKPANLLQ